MVVRVEFDHAEGEVEFAGQTKVSFGQDFLWDLLHIRFHDVHQGHLIVPIDHRRRYSSDGKRQPVQLECQIKVLDVDHQEEVGEQVDLEIGTQEPSMRSTLQKNFHETQVFCKLSPNLPDPRACTNWKRIQNWPTIAGSMARDRT